MGNNSSIFTVVIARDASLMTYCNPDLIITINRVKLDTNTPIVALNDCCNGKKFIPIYDTDLMCILSDKYKNVLHLLKPYIDYPKKVVEIFRKEAFYQINKKSNGKKVIVNPYYNAFTGELRSRGFIVIGPKDTLAREYSRKVKAFTLARSLKVPIAKGKITKDIRDIKDFIKKKKKGIFIASDSDPFYPENMHIKDKSKLEKIDQTIPYLVTEWIPKIRSPSSQVLVGNKQIIFLGITDQLIKKHTKYQGNIYPSLVPLEKKELIKRHTIILAEAMRLDGYRGCCGFDWIESKEHQILLSEINPRKTRVSGILFSFINYYKPLTNPLIQDLELAITLNSEPIIKDYYFPNHICWITEVYKTTKDHISKQDIVPNFTDGNAFKSYGTSIVNFPPKGNFLSKDLPDIARIIASGQNNRNIITHIKEKKNMILSAIT